MKKYIVWLLALGLVLGVTGCGKEKPFVKKVIVGFLAEDSFKTRDGGMDMEIEAKLIQKKIYLGVAKKYLPWGYAVATYRKDGKTYRYDEPITWTADRDDVVEITPMFPLNGLHSECRATPLGTKIGKTVLTATAQNGTVDSATVYVIPEIHDGSTSVSPLHKHAIVLDEEAWLSDPVQPGYGAKRWPSEPDVDVVFREDGIYFPYGAVRLNLDGNLVLRFDLVDWDTEVSSEPTLIPHDGSRWFLCHDKNGRKIALYRFNNSSQKPLSHLYWHAYENE